MSIKLSVLLNEIAEKIENNAELETFCQTNFSKSFKVYAYIDPDNPPKISNAPFIGLAIFGYEKPTNDNGRLLNFSLQVACFIEDSGETTSGKVTTLGGFAKLESFSDLVFDTIDAEITTSEQQQDMSVLSESNTSYGIADFPGFVASRSYTIGKRI